MAGLGSHDPLKRRWNETTASGGTTSLSLPPLKRVLALSPVGKDDIAGGVVPPVTVVLEGRSICHRVQLDRHASYESLAATLRRMFVVDDDGDGQHAGGLDLSNAVPGHMVAYEDMEDDLLLAGDLSWQDFVRVAKRIRIIPAKSSSR